MNALNLPVLDIAKIIDNWSTEIFNYFDYFVTNVFTESGSQS